MQEYISKRFPAFKSRDFSVFLYSQLVSNIGSQMQLVALNWHIYQLTHSALALGLLGLFRFVPIFVFSLIGGSVADSHNRKRILYVAQFFMILCAIILSFTTYTGTVNTKIIYLVTVFATIALSFEMPARHAFIFSLVKREQIVSASSLGSIFFQLSMIIGPTLSGLLIAHGSLELIYLLNALSFMFSMTGLYFIKADGKIQGEKVKVSITAVLEGLRFVKSKTMIWSTMLLDFFSTFFSSATALLPIFAQDILLLSPERLGLLYAAPSIGAVLAGIIIAQKHDLRRQGLALLFSITLFAIGMIIFGLSKIFWLSFLALIVVGFGDSISTIIRRAIRQLETPDYLRGRMNGINMIFFLGGPQLGEFQAGFLAQYMGAPFSVIAGGVGTLTVVILMGLKISPLRKYDRHQDIIEKL